MDMVALLDIHQNRLQSQTLLRKRPIYFSFNSDNSEAYFRKPNHGILLEDINAPENNTFFFNFSKFSKRLNRLQIRILSIF